MKRTIRDIEVKDKRVLVRVDFNVPIKDGKIVDDTRIKEALPTIKYLIDKGAKVILSSHLGRPDGKIKSEYSLRPCARRLGDLLGQKVLFSNKVIGKETTKIVNELKSGQVLMLENLRFMTEEENNTSEFCEKLAKLADVYVNDAFGTAHRKHASTYGVAQLLPNAIGFLIEKELNIIEENIKNPQKPFVVVLGGAKVSDKLTIVESLLDKANSIIIGGAMAYTFLLAQGYDTGNSLIEKDMVETAQEILQKAKDKGVNILLPIDHIETNDLKNPSEIYNTKDANITQDYMGVDIGKKTRKYFAKEINRAKLIMWNGPLGMFEYDEFSIGTKSIAKAVTKSKAISVVGGGDTASAIIQMGFQNKITHISTGGGASLKLFEGKQLAGVSVIADK